MVRTFCYSYMHTVRLSNILDLVSIQLTTSRALSEEYKDAGINVYASSDSTYVYEDKFKAVAYNQSDRMRPTLILLGTRLGIDRITPVYRKGLEYLLKLPQSLGIAGYVFPPPKRRDPSTNLPQWSTIVIALLHRRPEFVLLLPRSSSYPSRASVQRRFRIHPRRSR